MANNIDSTITIAGKRGELENIRTLLAKEYTYNDEKISKILSFENITPMPLTIFRGDLGEAERKIHGNNNWYDWSIKNWGSG